MTKQEFQRSFTELTDIPENRFHPLVWIGGDPEIGENVYIGGMSEIYAKGARVVIGDNCDIASFVSINCSDSHKRCIGISEEVDKQDIIIENNVYIGTQSYIGGGVHIGHHSVVGAQRSGVSENGSVYCTAFVRKKRQLYDFFSVVSIDGTGV